MTARLDEMRATATYLDPMRWIDRLDASLAAARGTPSADDVHDLRVAAARLIAWLEIGGRRALRDDLRWLRRAAGEVRDLDVILERHSATEWGAVLHHERAERARAFAGIAGSHRVEGLMTGLRCVPVPDADAARARVARLESRLSKAGARLESEPFESESLHRLRRRARRLRYAYEWLGDDAKPLAVLQERLGELQNLAVEDRHLAEHESDEGASERRRAIADELAEKRAAAVQTWRALERDEDERR